MTTKITIKGASKDEARFIEIIVRDAVRRVGGLTGWAHLAQSHREGLVAREGLALVLTQWGGAPADVLRRIAQLSSRVAVAASFDECMSFGKLTINLEDN